MTMEIEPTSLILVAIMNQPRDLEIARLFGWYRIPLKTAPKVVAVDHLAFYQTGAFQDSRWQIKYTAPVRGHELTTRAELLQEESDHPRANEEYYKIQLGSLVELTNSIKAGKWKRITFFYTTGEYLMSAVSINDLIVHSEERKILWKALRDRMMQEQSYRVDEYENVELDSEIISLLLGIKDLEGTYTP